MDTKAANTARRGDAAHGARAALVTRSRPGRGAEPSPARAIVHRPGDMTEFGVTLRRLRRTCSGMYLKLEI